MAALLTLPRELRDQIIDLVITARTPVPQAPTSIIPTPSVPRGRCSEFIYESRWKTANVAYLTNPEAYRPNALALLLTSRQLHSETLSRLTSIKPALELDVKVVCEHSLWPTWTRIPLGRPLDPVNVAVTVQACGDTPEKWYTSEWRRGPRGGFPSFLQSSFTGLLVRFLTFGPVGPVPGERLDGVEHPNRNININELRVNVMPPAAETGATGERSSAESIASAIALRVQVLTGWYPVKYGDLAYRRINKILITVDGVPFQTFDLARQLRFVPHHEKSIHYSYGSSYSASGPGYRNADELDEWWRTICQVRAQNGLDTPDEKALVECDEEELMKYRKEIRR